MLRGSTGVLRFGATSHIPGGFLVFLCCLLQLLGCDQGRSIQVRVCGPFVIPAERVRYVEVDGQVVDQRELTAEMGAEQGDENASDMEPEGLDPDSVQMDAFRLIARDAEFKQLQVTVHELTSGAPGPSKGFDRQVDFPPFAGTEWIQVEGLLRSVPVHWLTRRIGKLDELQRLQMPLSEGCYGIDCAFGQTCVSGGCELAPDETGGLSCPGSGGD